MSEQLRKARAGTALGTTRHLPTDDGEAWTIDEAAKRARLGRTLLYDAINPEKAAEKGLPVLPSLKIGKLRRVRAAAFRAWLQALEARAA